MRSLKNLILLFLVLSFDCLFAQEYEPVRIELPVALESDSYHTVMLEESGLLLFYESNELGDDGSRKWYFSLVDTALNERWMRYLGLTNGLSFVDQRVSGDQVALVFMDMQPKRNQEIAYEIVTYHVHTEKFSLLGGTFPSKATIADIALMDQKLLMGLNLDDYQADILLFDLSVGGLTSLETGLEGQLLINEMGVLPATKSFIVAIKQFDNKRFKGDRFFIFDTNGALRDTLQLPAIFPQYLGRMEFANAHNGSTLVVGTFDREKNGTPNLKDASRDEEREAAGLFYLRFGPNGFEKANYYDFSDFPNIYNALAAEDLMRIRQQQARSKDKDKTQYISFQFLKPELIITDSLLLFTAEAYRPQYRVESRIDYDFYGRPIPYTYTVFEGYQFFTSLLAGFNEEGVLQWSSDFEIRDLLSFNLKHHVTVYARNEEIVSVMLQGNSLVSQIVNLSGTLIGTPEKQPLALRFANDRLLDANGSSIRFWYGANFLLSGNQKIANNRLPKQNPRSVFFLQKVAFE